jgi:hypothetical protein
VATPPSAPAQPQPAASQSGDVAADALAAAAAHVKSTPPEDALAAAASQLKAAPAPAATRPAPAAPRPTGEPVAIAMVKSPIYVTRLGPSSIGFERSFSLPYKTRVPILEVQREQRTQRLRWFKVNLQGSIAWAREDFVTYEGDTTALGLPADLPPQMRQLLVGARV